MIEAARASWQLIQDVFEKCPFFAYTEMGTNYSRSWSSDRQVCGPIRGSWFNQTYFIGIENGFHYTMYAAGEEFS